jgi:hypothetical protein
MAPTDKRCEWRASFAPAQDGDGSFSTHAASRPRPGCRTENFIARGTR